jgi:Uma2 family endonuclease
MCPPGFWDNQSVSTALNIPLSLEEFMLRPDREDGQKEELIEGELIVSPAAKVWHAAIVRRLRGKVAPLEELGYIVGNDFACTLGGRSMPAPDLAAVSLERWNHAEDNDGWLEGAPELAVEVASPSNRKLQRKAVLYLEHGAEQVWLIYRKTQTVTVMTSEGTTEARMGETLEFRGVRVPVASFMKRG